jgi:ubiquinone/menaquinone biosynthesis C-methylase UbiE
MDHSHFWDIRAEHYDKLFWVSDEPYLAEIIALGDLRDDQLVLDVGTGTGKVAQAISKYVRHVVAIDMSEAMLLRGKWVGISTVKWDVGESFFQDALFDRAFARMCFHHILENLDRAIIRCYDLLKNGGRIVVAEGVPPADDEDVVDWYTKMFALKEERRTFTATELVYFLEKNGFCNVTCKSYYMEDFSVSNWVKNSGLDRARQEEIIEFHRQASGKIKQLYNMRVTPDDCIIRTKNVIVVGQKA